MKTYNNHNDISKLLTKDKQINLVISKMPLNYIVNLDCCLENQMYYPLVDLIGTQELITKFINYHHYCKNNNINFVNLMLDCKNSNMTAGKNSATSIITNKTTDALMKGINLTMRSILERKFDKNKIDDNLREGARQRKEYAKKLYSAYQHKHPNAHLETTHPAHTNVTNVTNVTSVTNLSNPISAIKAINPTNPTNITKVTKVIETKIEPVLPIQSTLTTNPITQVPTDIDDVVASENDINFNKPDAIDIPLSSPLDVPPVGVKV